MRLLHAVVVIFLTVLLQDASAEWCNFDDDDDFWNTEETYCISDCCYSSKKCCDFEFDWDNNNEIDNEIDNEIGNEIDYKYDPAPVIAGCSIGAFFFIVILIAAICACVNSGTRAGRVVAVPPPASVNTVTAVTSTGTGFTGQSGYAPPMQGYNPYPPGTQPPPPPAYNLPPGSLPPQPSQSSTTTVTNAS